MFELNQRSLQLIRKATAGKKHIQLTIGLRVDEHSIVRVFEQKNEIHPTENFQYEIGSITKTFTTSLLCKYLSQNELSLNDRIEKYIPSLTTNRYYPSLLQLATHTSGYPSRYPLSMKEYINLLISLLTGRNDISKENPLKMDETKMNELIRRYRLRNKDYPWRYSNFGIALLGYILGAISDKGYWETMNEFIQQELGLKDTTLGTANNNLRGYDKRNVDCGNWEWTENNLMSPAGGLSSTVDDLLQYASLHMSEAMPYLSRAHQKYEKGNDKYDMGLGWFLPKKNHQVLVHGGGTGCFSSFLAIDKEKKIASVVLANYRLEKELDEKIGLSLVESVRLR